MPEQSSLAARICEAREMKKLTPAQTANRVGVKLKTFQNWESGRTEPRANRLQMLAGVLGVPLFWLIQGGEEHDPVLDQSARLDQLEVKMERLHALQRELTQLTSELSAELAHLRDVDDQLEELVA